MSLLPFDLFFGGVLDKARQLPHLLRRPHDLLAAGPLFVCGAGDLVGHVVDFSDRVAHLPNAPGLLGSPPC